MATRKTTPKKKEVKKKEIEQTLTLEDLTKQYNAEIENYAEYVKNIKNIEDIDKEIEDKRNDLNQYQETLSSKEYALPAEIKYKDQPYTSKQIFDIIHDFLNKKGSVEWSNANNMILMDDVWMSDTKTISFINLHNTMAFLEKFLYCGREEWENILVINDYFAQCTSEYRLDTATLTYKASLYDVAQKERNSRVAA